MSGAVPIDFTGGGEPMTTSVFAGEAVALRPFEPDDVPALAAYLNQPELAGCRYIPWGRGGSSGKPQGM